MVVWFRIEGDEVLVIKDYGQEYGEYYTVPLRFSDDELSNVGYMAEQLCGEWAASLEGAGKFLCGIAGGRAGKK